MAKHKAGKTLPKDSKGKFLAELAQTTNVSATARKAGVETTAIYKVRRSNAEFYRHWQEAWAEGFDNLEMDVLRRLRIGELTGGRASQEPRQIRQRHRVPAAFRAPRGGKHAKANKDEDAIVESINEKLSKMRKRQLAMHASVQETDVISIGHDAGQ